LRVLRNRIPDTKSAALSGGASRGSRLCYIRAAPDNRHSHHRGSVAACLSGKGARRRRNRLTPRRPV